MSLSDKIFRESIERNRIPTESIREKLKNLKQYMPSMQKNEFIYNFANFLSQRLEGECLHEISPSQLYEAAEHVLSNLKMAAERPLAPGTYLEKEWYCYSLMRQAALVSIPDIAKAICPKDFAQGVEEISKESYQKIVMKIR